jgi:WXXGXW repeat (2 copies)
VITVRTIRSIKYLLFAAILFAIPAATFAQIGVGVGISVRVAPPALPVYAQPICPGDGYIWTPGYWAYGEDDYYWVPGTWVQAPRVGVLWTPGYWGWGGGVYLWHGGYWGPHVGFYGGINYGFGYGGVGYLGGRWDGGHFAYNRAVNNVNVTVIHNTYNTRITNVNSARVSFNGGAGGVRAEASVREQQAAREQHIQATSLQTRQQETARSNPAQFAGKNHGQPAVAATPRPGAFNDKGVVRANAAANGRAANTVNANNSSANATRSDRPSTATQSNAARGTTTNRPNTAQTNAARGNTADRPANARTVTPRNTPSDRPSNAPRSNERSTPQHATPQHATTSKPAEKSAPQQHSAPRSESKPQSKEREPHGKS